MSGGGEASGGTSVEPAPRWLDAQEQRAWRAILRANHLMRVSMDGALHEHGVSLGEYELLSMVSEAPGGRLRMASLAELVVQSRSRVSHTATRLERRGWVRREPAAEDGRGVLLVLTSAGREAVERLAPVHVESVRAALLDHLTREELLDLGETMRRVVLVNRTGEEQAGDAV
jgi:DNA-binding MarR family transcriptional regulator